MTARPLALAVLLALSPALATAAEEAPAKAAKWLFGAHDAPSAQDPASHGSYAKGCLAGGVPIAAEGPGWQTMRPSRNRAWGRPEARDFVMRLGAAAQGAGWPGLLIGDVSQPRGGPMTSGHRSHQIGLDIDIWFTPAPKRALTREEREGWGAATMVAGNRKDVNKRWTDAHAQILKAAAEDPAVARIFVNAAIKQAVCAGGEEPWMRKLRPWWGHDAHFHVRLACPGVKAGCFDQAPPPPGPGCDASLAWWFSDEALNPKPKPKTGKPKKKPGPLTLADLPQACGAVLAGKTP